MDRYQEHSREQRSAAQKCELLEGESYSKAEIPVIALPTKSVLIS